MTDQSIIFKNSKTGKVEQIAASDFDIVNFQNFGGSWGIRIFLKNGTLHRYVGFRDSEKEKIAKFFSSSYKLDTLEKEISVKGWNWGTAKFNGAVLNFDVGSNSAFEIPLNYVSQCTGGKNEITMEFHQVIIILILSNFSCFCTVSDIFLDQLLIEFGQIFHRY